MLVPVSWLKEYVDITLTTEELAERITLAGLEVASIQRVGDWWDPDKIRVGQILAVRPHPNADRLVLVDVDYGGEAPETVVTGAPNLFQYRDQAQLPVLKVAFARAGAVLIDAYSDQQPRPKKKLKPSKIRGVRSAGMVCSERELGLSEEHEGILVLPEDAPVGMPLRDYLGDEVLELELTPDMARCLSMAGVAREVAALTDAPLHLPPDQWRPAGEDQAEEYVAVAIEAPELCNRYVGAVIRDVTVGPSPRWMQERLIKAGMRPINNIVDITNYTMLELGQPLHAFDYDLLLERARRSGADKPTIIVRTAQPGEKITTLDGVERELDESMLLIADTAGPIAIAGVMGGAETEVHEGTRNILLESATFHGINNRRTAQKLKLHSEASHRFTRGVPATLNPIAARRASELMRQHAGARIVPGLVDAYPVPQPEVQVFTTESEVQRQLGMDLPLLRIANVLEKLDFRTEERPGLPEEVPQEAAFGLHVADGEPVLACWVPWHRLDVHVPADLTEEVARMVGYERVGTTLMNDVLPPQRRNPVLEAEERIRDILVACGLQETINYSLTTPENHDRLHPGGPSSQEAGVPYVTLANPLTPERRVLRRSLLVSALENLAYNRRFTDRLAVFEVGRVYLPELSDDVRPYEERRLSLLLTGPRRETNIHPDPAGQEEFDFFDLKGVVETLLDRLGFKEDEVVFEARPDTGAFGPRCAEVFVQEQSLGLMGELHPRVRAAWNLPEGRVCLAELRLMPLVRPAWQLEVMPPISVYPPVIEDLAFVVAEDVTVRQVVDAIRRAGGNLLVDVELFDIYRGDPIPAGQKSLAFRVTYQAVDHSLSEKEVARLRQRIIKTVERETGGKLRG